MDEPSRLVKWLIVVVMLVVTAATVWGTLTYGNALMTLAVTYGPPDQLPQMYLWGALVAVCLVAWIATYMLCALIQRSLSVWGGFSLLPLLLLAVIGFNFGPHYGPQMWADLHYKLFEESDQKAITAVKEDNLTQIIVNADMCRAEMKKLGFPEFMFVYNLAAPHGLETARDKIKKARAIVLNCQARDNVRVEKFRHDIQALDVAEKAKAEALAIEFGSGAEADRARIRQLETQLIDEFEAVLDDLAAAKDRWYVSGGQLVFIRQRDLDRFNAHISKIRRLAAQADDAYVRMRSRDKTHYVVVAPYRAD